MIGEEDCDLRNTIHSKFSALFKGLGNLGEPYTIKLQSDAKPHSLFTARKIPLPLCDVVKEELDSMESMGVISRVDYGVPVWYQSQKETERFECVDLKRLNESVLREVFPLPEVDDALAQLSGAKIFTKLDANSGFWQIPLSDESRLLTTFITPFGRYCFNKLPFGISSAPEHFQKRMNHILSGLDGVICLVDDVLVFGSNKRELDSRLMRSLERIRTAGVTLNKDKCEFGKDKISFLGHTIDGEGIHADPEKTDAIKRMEPPTSITELRRFMGMVNQLGKFSAKLSGLTHPLRMLLGTKNSWSWGEAQEQAFVAVKEELLKPTTLAHYNPKGETKISADASMLGLGAVLLQKHDEVWKPASRSLSDTETRYAQIKKEALASTWACEKFSKYILGLKFTIETDHKPLVALLGYKELDQLPPRVLRFCLRLARFDYSIIHVPGKLLYTADTLSRAPLPLQDDTQQQEEFEELIVADIQSLPASSSTGRHSQGATF